MKKRTPAVTLIDENPLFRMAMAHVLKNEAGFEIVGETNNSKTALQMIDRTDIVIMGLIGKHYDALSLLQTIKARRSKVRVIVMMEEEDQLGLLMRAIRLDANGYLLRTIDPEEFLSEIMKVASGGMAASEELTSALAQRLRGDVKDDPNERYFHFLTDREQDVLCCVAAGLSNSETADELGITLGTVKVHVKHLLKKLNFRSRVEVAVWASDSGFRLEGRMPKPSLAGSR